MSTAIICPHIAVDMQAVGRITEILKKVEEAGFEEVILYFNVCLKPHSQVKEEMARFAAEIHRGRFTQSSMTTNSPR